MGGLGVKAAIERIVIKERIRKDITKISELAEDIKKNGLINPVTVMVIDEGMFQLLAGLRRIRAVQSIGLTEIEVNVVSPADGEAILRIEISENEQREQFTPSEQSYYGKLLDAVEEAKAKERMSEGGKGGLKEGTDRGPYLNSGERRDIIGAQLGMSGRQYDRLKYVSENASPEIMEQLDKGERSIRGTYDKLKAKKKSAAPPTTDYSSEAEDFDEESEYDDLPEAETKTEKDSKPAPKAEKPPKAESKPKRSLLGSKSISDVPEEELLKLFSKKDIETMRKAEEFNAMSPEEKVVELQRQLKEMLSRAMEAESERDTLKYEYGIKADHKDSIIDSLKRRNAELCEALDAAEKRIAEMEK
jgi:ParB family chromosome partitioning protein